MLNNTESLTPKITDVAYEAAYAANTVYDDLRSAEIDLEQKTRLANLYERSEGAIVFAGETATLENRVVVAGNMFSLLCDAAGVVMRRSS